MDTCKLIVVEVKEWFAKPKSYKDRFKTTAEYGLIDTRNTHFALIIDDAFRERELCKVDESQGIQGLQPICRCCTKFDRVFYHVNWEVITSLALHFKTEDSPGRRDNANAIKALTSLLNLQNLNILLGDVGSRWNYSREQWQRDDGGDGHFWIPASVHSFLALIPLADEPLPFAIKVWIVMQGADSRDRIELLVSYNETAEGRGGEFPIADLCSVVEG